MQFSYWQYFIGDVLFVATLIAKSWRIYRIFFNKKLKKTVRVDLAIAVFSLHVPATFPSLMRYHFEFSYRDTNSQTEFSSLVCCY